MVDVDETDFVTALLEAGVLTEAQALDPLEVADAAASLLDEWSRRWIEHARAG